MQEPCRCKRIHIHESITLHEVFALRCKCAHTDSPRTLLRELQSWLKHIITYSPCTNRFHVHTYIHTNTHIHTEEKRKAALVISKKNSKSAPWNMTDSRHSHGPGKWSNDVAREREMSSSPRTAAQWQLETPGTCIYMYTHTYISIRINVYMCIYTHTHTYILT